MPLRRAQDSIPAGVAVSIDFNSQITLGGGLSIYRDVHVDTNDEMTNVQTCALNDFVVIAAWTGNIRAFGIDMHDFAHTGDSVCDRVVSASLGHSSFHSGRQDPCCRWCPSCWWQQTLDRRCQWGSSCHRQRHQKGAWACLQLHFWYATAILRFWFFILGVAYKFSSYDESYPHADTLGDDSICVTFEEADNQLYTFTATINGQGTGANVGAPTPIPYSEKYSYHGITGLSKDKYVVASCGPIIGQNFTGDHIRARLITVNPDHTLKLHDWSVLNFTASSTFFAIDNLDDQNIVIVYYNEHGTSGMIAQHLAYDRSTDNIAWGTSVVLRSASGNTNLERIKMRILSPDRFGVFFDDVAATNSQGLVFLQGIMGHEGQLQKLGGSVPIIEARREPWSFAYYDITPLNFERFVCVESYGDNRRASVSLSVGDQKFIPLGLTTETLLGEAVINYEGLYYANANTFTPGYSYYTNSRGELIRGRPYGSNNQDYESYYVYDQRSNCIVSTNNLIGYAVAHDILMIKTI